MKKSVIITGSSRGIGAACAIEYSKQGCSIMLQGRDEEKLKIIQARCKEAGAKDAIYCALSLEDTDKLELIIEKTIENFGRIDILGICVCQYSIESSILFS